MKFVLVSIRVAMYRYGLLIPEILTSTTKLCEASLCATTSWKCYDRQCHSCGTSFLKVLLREWVSLSSLVTIYHWERVTTEVNKKEIKRLTVTKKEMTRKKVVFLLSKLLHGFARHHFVANHQWKSYTLALDNLSSNTALCVLDFAENYTAAIQGVVQSAYYSRNSITLHPIVVHYKRGEDVIRDSVVFISDDRKHDWAAVKCFVQNLAHHLGIMAPHISNLIMFSEGCSSQYKSRNPFASIATGFDQELRISWNWFWS